MASEIKVNTIKDLGGNTVVSSNGSGTVNYNTHILPSSNNALDLGSASASWRNVYTGDLHLSNKNHDKGNDIDNTKGNWTIQEGENNLYLINNKNKKKYKFNLEEVE